MSHQLVTKGRFGILLQGRHAGKKVVVLATYPEGTESRPFACATVLGVERAPKKLQKDMPVEQMVKRTQVRSFIKTVNYSHFLVTRHAAKEEFWNKLDLDGMLKSLDDPETKKACISTTNESLRQKYLNNICPWFFQPHRF